MANSGTPIAVKPEQAMAEAAMLGEKIARGAELFSKLRDERREHRHHARRTRSGGRTR